MLWLNMNTCSIFFDLCGGCLISYRLWRSTLWSWKLPRCQSLIFSLQSYVVPFESYRSLIKVKYDLILMSLNMLSVLRFPSVHWLLFLSHLSSWDRRVLLKPRKRYILVFIGRPLSPTELDLKDNDQNPSSSLLSSKRAVKSGSKICKKSRGKWLCLSIGCVLFPHHLALPFLLVFLWDWQSYPLFDFAPHRWRPACLVSALSYLESEKYTPLLVKADLYAYSDAEGSATSFCSKDSRPDLKPSFTRHLVEKDLVNLEIWFWYRVNLFFLLLRMLVFLHSPMPVKGLRYILTSSWAKEHKREWFLYKLQ